MPPVLELMTLWQRSQDCGPYRQGGERRRREVESLSGDEKVYTHSECQSLEGLLERLSCVCCDRSHNSGQHPHKHPQKQRAGTRACNGGRAVTRP